LSFRESGLFVPGRRRISQHLPALRRNPFVNQVCLFPAAAVSHSICPRCVVIPS